MTEAKFTPGPWAWQRWGKSLCLVGDHSDRPIVMDFVRSGMQGATARFRNLGLMCPADRDPVTDEFPDARLIAAAPDLYAALGAWQRAFEDLVAPILEGMEVDAAVEVGVGMAGESAHAALAKARGEAPSD